MNYIKQVNRFYELLLTNPLNANSIAVYMTLLHINNKCNWTESFSVANSTLMTFTGLNISAFQRARNNLVQKGYIDYEKGKSNIAGNYTIIELEPSCENHNEQQSEQHNEQQSEQQTDSTTNNRTNTLYKLNKTKLDYFIYKYINNLQGKDFSTKVHVQNEMRNDPKWLELNYDEQLDLLGR